MAGFGSQLAAMPGSRLQLHARQQQQQQPHPVGNGARRPSQEDVEALQEALEASNERSLLGECGLHCGQAHVHRV
jgi:hypothetical protein